jgi:hypothetical protein
MYDRPILPLPQRPLNILEGIHLATNQPVEIVLTPTESRLAQGKTNEEWNALCVSIEMRTGHIIQGQIQIDYLIIDGIKRAFH